VVLHSNEHDVKDDVRDVGKMLGCIVRIVSKFCLEEEVVGVRRRRGRWVMKRGGEV